jgi:hypothetical protein
MGWIECSDRQRLPGKVGFEGLAELEYQMILGGILLNFFFNFIL